MPEPTAPLRPALCRPVHRRELAVATTVLVASAAGGVLVALLQPARAERGSAPLVLPLPVPQLVNAAPAAVAAAPLIDLAPVIDDGALRVVLATDVEPQWIGDPIDVRDDDGVRVVARPLSARGRERFSRVVGATLRLFDRDRAVCSAEVSGLTVVGRFAPDDLGEADHPVSAAAAWTAADGSYLLAGDLRVVAGDCAGALLARPTSLGPPAFATVQETSPELARRAADMLRAEDAFADATGGSDATFEVEEVSLAGGEKLLVASALVEGCVDREPVLSALYAVQPDGALHPLGAPARVASIEAAADFDRDGHVELLVRGDSLDVSILRRRAGTYVQEAHTVVPIDGCRC